MAERQAYDVVVAGAGMVGLALALSLRGSGLRALVVDPRPPAGGPEESWKVRQRPYDPRVSALTRASVNLLTNLGAWARMEEYGVCPYHRMQVWDGEGTGEIIFDADEIQQPDLGCIVENRLIVSALEALAQEDEATELAFGRRIAEVRGPEPGAETARTLILDDGRELRTRLLAIADGGRSPTRTLAGLTVIEQSYDHDAVVCTLQLAGDHRATCWQVFTDDGPLAWLPLADPAQVAIVWSTSPDHAARLMALDDEAFARAAGERLEWRLGAVQGCSSRQRIPLVQRHAPRYVAEGLALLGDAAHGIHPLAGQGVNLGFLDAATLAEELARAASLGLDIGAPEILRRYQRRRQAANVAMIGLMGAFRALYSELPPPLHWLRNQGVKTVAALAPLRGWLAEQALGDRPGNPALMQNRA